MIPSLNGLRAIAILLVISAHLYIQEGIPAWFHFCLKPIHNGEVGVRLFFVISGYLITWLLLFERKKRGKNNLKAFYLRRILRIFPVFYFYVLIVFVTTKLVNHPFSIGIYFTSLAYVQNFAFLGSNWLLAHSWSLSVEEQFYLIWPSIFSRLKEIFNKRIFILILAAGCIGRIIAYKYPFVSNLLLLPFLKHVDFLFGGCYLAYLTFSGNKILKEIGRLPSWVLILGFIFILGLSSWEGDPTFDKIFLPITGTFSVIYFVVLISWTTNPKNQNTRICLFLNNPWVQFVGILSYSLYIWQQYFLIPSYNPFSKYWWARFPQNALLIFPTALLSYYLIEKPFLRLKAKISK